MIKQMMKLLMLTLMSCIFMSCEQSTSSKISKSSGKHPVSMSMSSYTVAKFNAIDLLFPKAYAAISDLKFCFKRLRFKKDLPDGVVDATEDNIDIELGEVQITSSGLDLGTVSVPADTYKRVEFDLERDCVVGSTQNSVSLINDFGTYNSTDRITIKFDGTFIVDGAESVVLDVQNIMDAANSYDGTGTLKDALEAVSGNL